MWQVEHIEKQEPIIVDTTEATPATEESEVKNGDVLPTAEAVKDAETVPETVKEKTE